MSIVFNTYNFRVLINTPYVNNTISKACLGHISYKDWSAFLLQNHRRFDSFSDMTVIRDFTQCLYCRTNCTKTKSTFNVLHSQPRTLGFATLWSHPSLGTRLLYTSAEGPEGGVPIPFPTWNFGKIPVPVGFLLEIPVRVIEIPVNKKPVIYR
jgi:hypothetical protein